MARYCSVIVTLAVAVALCLGFVGCRTQADDPGAHNAQSDPPNIEATVQAAMRSLEERQPATPAEGTNSASVSAPSAATPAGAPSRRSSPGTHQTPVGATAALTALEPTGSPVPPPTVPLTTRADAVASTEQVPTPTPDGADLRPPAPMFAGAIMDGSQYRLEDTVGSPTLLMFWAPW